MHKEINHLHKFRIFNTIALVVFCFAVGEVIAILLTGLIYGVNSFQIFETLKEPSQANRSLLILFSCFSTLFRFMLVPVVYLVFTDKGSLSFLWIKSKVRFTPMLLTVVLVLVLMPCSSILIDLNYRLELPIWLSELETYFKDGEEKARHLTSYLFAFKEPGDLAIAMLIVAIIPGIAEEFLFRGIVQLQLQKIFKNHHYTILLSAALFSFFHFQFYGFIPRLALGMLFGYIFYWSKNIWYPMAMHIMNNLIGVLGVYFLGPQIMNPDSGSSTVLLLVFPSVVVSVLIVLNLKRSFTLTAIAH